MKLLKKKKKRKKIFYLIFSSLPFSKSLGPSKYFDNRMNNRNLNESDYYFNKVEEKEEDLDIDD